MQDIREIEFRDSGSNADIKICFEVRATALRPRLHTEGLSLRPHRTSHKGNLHRGICNYKLGVYNSALQYNHVYTRGKAQSQNSITSQEGQGTKPNHNHLYTRGIDTKLNNNHNHLYTKGIRHKAKEKKKIQSW